MADPVIPQYDVHEPEFKEIVMEVEPVGMMLPLAVACFVVAAFCAFSGDSQPLYYFPSFFFGCAGLFIWKGINTLEVNDAVLCTLCGKYVGSIKEPGMMFVNPMYSTTKMSLKTSNFETKRTVVNDLTGVPIVIQGVIVWKVKDTAAAIFEVENYQNYISIQCESAIRELAAKYPYDTDEDGAISLRGSQNEIAHALSEIVTERVKKAGIEVVEAKISHLAYTDQIAASMLRVQQADALIAAREKIVAGAVGMVKMAIDEIESQEVVSFSNEKKAALVCNLLVVLCGEEKEY